MACIRKVALIVNCGYARACIYENSRNGRKSRKTIDSQKRLANFKLQFGTHSEYGIPIRYFEAIGRDNICQFDRDCNKVLDGFKSKFRDEVAMNRDSYLSTFSLAKWSALPSTEKNRHTISNCVRCYEMHEEQQRFFPLKPLYQPQPVLIVNKVALEQQGLKTFTSNVLKELNRVYEDEATTSFTDSLLQTKSLGLERKKTPNEKRKEKRDTQKKIVKKVTEHFSEKATITLLTEGESKRKYHRKRLAQSFCSPEEPLSKRKKHSPNFERVSWDTEKLRTTLLNRPTEALINWSEVGREHGISGENAGQVVKEFAKENNITHITTPNRRHTKRPCKKKLPGFGVSIPSNPPVRRIEAEIKSMISSGRFTLGEECAPYRITKYVPVNGKLTPQDTFVQARKVPLTQLRQRTLKKQFKYMRLTPTSSINAMTKAELIEKLQQPTMFDSLSEVELRQLLIHTERSRSLCLWHDHATILKMGFLMITVHVMYDPLVFYTDEEFRQQNPGSITCIQSEVEQPEIHLLSAGSSTVEDQAAIIGDRINCLLDLSTPIEADNGIPIRDTLRFFTGDHPATQFEQGSKQGGTYKCGACGCNEKMFDDQAHSLFHEWRTLEQLQSLAIGGNFGKRAGILRPFDNLKVNDIRTELGARGICIEGMLKDHLKKTLNETLRGVMRVPALLLTDPTQCLSSLNLRKYEVIASEPLHDIKGHIINLITELPYVLPPGDTAIKCTHLIDCCLSKEKKSGADLRRAIIQIYLLLKDLECSSKVLLLLQTIIKVAEISYSKDIHRSPRQLLQLYNACWLHMELCRDLFSAPQKITRSKMFGHYLHAITSHSPTQYELACLRSINTENQERLFGQARAIADMCTNHHAENVIPQIMLRLQAKQEKHIALLSVQKGDSQVSHVAKQLPQLPGTSLKMSFIKKREDSWQLHLQRVSPFLTAGEGVWWTRTVNGFHFHDGDTDSSTQMHSITLFHYRCQSITDVQERRKTCWNKIIEERIAIPSYSIKVYDQGGEKTGQLVYDGDGDVAFEASTSVHQIFSSDPDTSTVPSPETEGAVSDGPMSDPVSNSLQASDCPVSEGCPAGYSMCEDHSVQDQLVEGGPDSSEVASSSSSNHISATSSQLGGVGEVPSPYIHLTLAEEEDDEGLKTSLATSIKKLLEHADGVTEFDQLRFKLKKARKTNQHRNMKDMISRYTILAATLGTKVSNCRSKLHKQIQTLEQEHFQLHDKLPSKISNTQYSNLLRQRKLAVTILRNLNMEI